MRLQARVGALAIASAAALWPGLASAFGPEGHLIAGRVAASHLCRAAAAEVGRLGGGDGLDNVGLWADRVRREPRYAASAPWHYMNIDDGTEMSDYVSPPEGDVLSALARYHAVLSDEPRAPDPERSEAFRFLTHFVVDLHQPLHVGRAADRGGNAIDVIVDGKRINLHRLWDTESITTAGLGVVAYARTIGEDITPALLAGDWNPRAWADESLQLRAAVYDFPGDNAVLDQTYLQSARRITQERLTLAAARLAATLNGLFCR